MRLRGIFQIHGPILKLKLRIPQVAKLASFAAAMYKKTTHQMAQQYVLFRRTEEWAIFGASEEWCDWCRKCNRNGDPPNGHFMADRDVYAGRLSKWPKAIKNARGRSAIRIVRTWDIGSDGAAVSVRRVIEGERDASMRRARYRRLPPMAEIFTSGAL